MADRYLNVDIFNFRKKIFKYFFYKKCIVKTLPKGILSHASYEINISNDPKSHDS